MNTVDENNLDEQYRKPFGTVGVRIGEEMAHDHIPENQWTVAQVNPRPTDHLLEIGFGPGVAIELLLPHIPQGKIAGIDHSELMVQEATTRNATAVAEGRVALQHGDAATLPFADSAFDTVYTTHTVYFWRAPMVVLAEIRRVLKAGGLVVITMLPKEKWGANPAGAPQEYGTPDCTPYTIAEMESMLRDAGFQHIETRADANSERPSNLSVVGRK